jgi:hypothetical protein
LAGGASCGNGPIVFSPSPAHLDNTAFFLQIM